MKYFNLFCLLLISQITFGQNVMTPEKLLELGRVSGMGITEDKEFLIYGVKYFNVPSNSGSFYTFKMPINGGDPIKIKSTDGLLPDDSVSPDGNFKLSAKDVKIDKVYGTDYYPEMKESNVMIYDDLNYRHWDHFEDGAFSHVLLK